MNRIFLGGTRNNSTWRKKIQKWVQLSMFNPVVDNWTEKCQAIEINEKENRCDIHLYVITSEMTGVFSIAEAIDSMHNNNKITLLHVIPDGFNEAQLKSLKAVVDLVKSRGGIAYIDSDLARTARVLNTAFK